MDGTVILEEHFATEATLGDSQQFGLMCGPSCAIGCSISRTSGCV